MIHADWFPPWRRQRPPATAGQGARLPEQRHAFTVSAGPGAVRRAREETAIRLARCGIATGSALSDAVLLVVSELVTNVLRHTADRSPTADVTVEWSTGQLVVAVADHDPRLPAIEVATPGAGLGTVRELTAWYDGTLGVEPHWTGQGKRLLATFRIPASAVRPTTELP
ncbi:MULTISPECIES: ATP-binding protein [Streptomyces]|uniref:Histidine kinase-like ATPase domain-containing protein n=1 Tax=Streptomyces yunnanensis TaxID=156453 RepID=A0A9X8N4D0_9ACTN|nr:MULTISPECIES: ATP-binding protein [Streptomyces]SHM92191.1 Histidine kinase-like ATPase domain-containing protein [Streptomyces yunnanensis]